ncbi:MAG: hypothetical protein AB2535_14650 [Candidatus Thiodiazotropha endolucinida]
MVVDCEPPLSICRIQWLDLRECIPIEEKEANYRPRFKRLLLAIEENKLDFEGRQHRLIKALHPLEFDADILSHVPKFTGRQWVFDALQDWLALNNPDSRVFWICGGPGVGKTTLSAVLANRYSEVAALHLCKYGHAQKSDPRRVVTSIAYQLSTQLPEYETRLASLEVERMAQDDAPTLFDNLLVQPLSTLTKPDRAVVILIDALDEAGGSDGLNTLASFIAAEFPRTPGWLRLVITSRPEKEVTVPLQGLNPFFLDTETEANHGDIIVYLRRELASLLQEDADSDQLIEQIFSKSEGVFLYVERICHDLQQGYLSLDRLDLFPQGLGGVFWRYFERQFQDLERFRRNVRPALRAILAAREPLSVEILRGLFGWQDEELRDFVRDLGVLFPVTAEGKHRVIKPWHKTLVDWLTDEDTAGVYYTSIAEGNGLLASTGLREIHSDITAAPAYWLMHTPYHLGCTAAWEEAHGVLMRFDFIRNKLERFGPQPLIEDYEYFMGTLPGSIEGLDAEIHETLKLTGEAIRLSCHVLTRDTNQLASQLTGRLLGINSARVRAMLEQIQQLQQKPWLRPITPSLTPPNAFLMRTLVGHKGPVEDVAVTADGSKIISASCDAKLRVWEASTGGLIRILTGHEDAVTGVSVLGSNDAAASISFDGSLRVWDLITGKAVYTKVFSGERLSALAVNREGTRAAIGNTEGNIVVWDVSQKEIVLSKRLHEEWVTALAFSPAGDKLVSGSTNIERKILDIKTGRVQNLNSPFDNEGSITGVAITPDGKKVLVTEKGDAIIEAGDKPYTYKLGGKTAKIRRTSDGVTVDFGDQSDIFDFNDVAPPGIRIWELETTNYSAELLPNISGGQSITISHDGYKVASATGNKIYITNLDSREETASLQGHSNTITSLEFIQGSKWIVSGSRDNTVRIWAYGQTNSSNPLQDDTRRIFGLTLTPDLQTCLGYSERLGIRVWNISQGNEKTAPPNLNADQFAISPDGCCLVTGSLGGQIILWDWPSGDRLFEITGLKFLNGIDFTTDGTKVILRISFFTDDNKTHAGVVLFDIVKKELVKTFIAHDNIVHDVVITPDGKILATSASDGMRITSSSDAAGISGLAADSHYWISDVGWVRGLVATPDSKYIVGYHGSGFSMWALETGTEVYRIELDEIDRLKPIGDGKKLIVGTKAGLLSIRFIYTGEELWHLPGNSDAIGEIVVSPDESMVVYVSNDMSIRLWNLNKRQQVASYTCDGDVTGLQTTGESVIVTDGIGQIHFLEIKNISKRPGVIVSDPHASRYVEMEGRHSIETDGAMADKYYSLLHSGGYHPDWTPEGYLTFEREGLQYLIVPDPDDIHYVSLLLPSFWPLKDEVARCRARVAAEKATRMTKVAKVYLTQDCSNVNATVESFFSDGDRPIQLFDRALESLSAAVEKFRNTMQSGEH